MKKRYFRIRFILLAIALLSITGRWTEIKAQDLRWMRIGSLQSFFMDFGTECESYPSGVNDLFAWPAAFGDLQFTVRSRGLWLGCKNFNDPVLGKVLSTKVVSSGPRYDPTTQPSMIFGQKIRLYTRSTPPIVTVDNQSGSNNSLYDAPDDILLDLPSDRLIDITFNTSIGVSVHKKVYGFTQQNHDNYFIHDYVFTNTGIVDAAGTVKQQTLNDFWAYYCYRYAFAGVTSTQFGSTWGAFASQWGETTQLHDFGPYRNSPLRGFYSYYGPAKERSNVNYAQDWGCPNQLGGDVPGCMGSAKYCGAVTLFASKSAQDWTDDNNQPATTAYTSSDQTIMSGNVSQYDASLMDLRYKAMTEGHLAQAHDESVGNQYESDWQGQHIDRDGGGGTSQEQGFGPYTLNPGDSIHIVFAEGVSGLSWENCVKIGANWYQYYKGLGTPTLVNPDGSTPVAYTDNGGNPYSAADAYKKAWHDTGKDSIMQTLRNAVSNFSSGYKIPQAPPAPAKFTVQSGGDRIRLIWDGNASSAPHFNGYVIYRSRGIVKDYKVVYEKVFECDKSYSDNFYDDKTPLRGFNYYYYIQSKDDGTQNDVYSGIPLYSSKFLTMTSVPATLQRPAVTEPSQAPNSDTTNWKPLSSLVNRGAWSKNDLYRKYDLVQLNGDRYVCVYDSITAKTKQADSVNAVNAPSPEDRSGYYWEADTTRWRKLVSKGEWASGSVYKKYVTVNNNGAEYICMHDIAAGSMIEQVRVVPNPYDIRSRKLQFGTDAQYDQIAFYQLPPVCKLIVFTERGDKIWEMDHTKGTGDEAWTSQTMSAQILVSGIYILYVEVTQDVQAVRDVYKNGALLYHAGDVTTHKGDHIIRKFVVIR